MYFFKFFNPQKYFFPTETKFNFWKLQGITDAQYALVLELWNPKNTFTLLLFLDIDIQ